MIPVLDAQHMRDADRETIDGLGVPSLVLMEMAASGVTEAVLQQFADAGRAVVVCGPGNNGGDGLAVARQLRCRGMAVEAWLAADPSSLHGDAAKQLELARGCTVPVMAGAEGGLEGLQGALAQGGVVIDALFGTGLDRPLEGQLAEVVRLVNASGVPIVAVDIPSGLSGSSSGLPGESIEATITVTFGAPKVAHVLPPACRKCGEVAVADIGIPPWVLEERAVLWLVEERDVAAWLPTRAPDAHKGHFGHLVVLAGRLGRAGAAAMAARAGVLSGAGLVTVATTRSAVAPIQSFVPEAMVDALPEDEDGAVAGCDLDPIFAKATALAVGPGLGLGAGARALVDRVVAEFSGALLLDADALTLLAGRLDALAGRSGPTVLTPHPGELARVLGCEVADVVADRVGAARRAAERSSAVVLAKGAHTVIATPQERILVNPTGTAGLASGGAGDTLTGLIGGLLAQGVGALPAAACGAFLHGRAAELATDEYPGAVEASALADYLPRALAEALDRR